ncbi:MAG: type II toxin-antitoxin system RelE/ParE family toxin [bacterium]|nr:type II toxin-antitoxin system RelE/ParE family toxin [bacterium]
MAYNIIFYENTNGISEVWNFLENLRHKSLTNKDARIQYNQVELYIQLLQDNGTKLPSTITKHIEEDIWELRPGNNRIFYFFSCDDSFVLLHSFRKKTRKTPRREINKAKAERNDYIFQKENEGS